MAEKRSLNHFALFSLTSAFWEADAATQHEMARELPQRLRGLAEQVHGYRIFPSRAEADILIWSALHAEDTGVAGQFFSGFADALAPFRRYLRPTDTLWGFTRPSVYAGGRTAQEIDPFVPDRKPYLVIYPFAKTVDWYLMSRDSRQGMMNEHIRVGREYPEIMQLLLYTTGLQDQEFVVSYETTDLVQFSELVTTLRNTDARRYTLRDTPIYTATYQPLDRVLPLTER
jgi:chlorite dismutase